MQDLIATGLVLAGGLGTRLGGVDKALVRLGGSSLVEHALTRLAPQVAAVAISANGDPGRFAMCRAVVLPDTVPGFRGPLAGILAGLEWTARRDERHMVSVAVDTPFFPRNLMTRLGGAVLDPDGIVVARSRGRLHPVFALWPVSCREALERFLDEDKVGRVMDFIETQGLVAIDFDDVTGGVDPFFNINTPDDLATAAAMAAGQEA